MFQYLNDLGQFSAKVHWTYGAVIFLCARTIHWLLLQYSHVPFDVIVGVLLVLLLLLLFCSIGASFSFLLIFRPTLMHRNSSSIHTYVIALRPYSIAVDWLVVAPVWICLWNGSILLLSTDIAHPLSELARETQRATDIHTCMQWNHCLRLDLEIQFFTSV